MKKHSHQKVTFEFTQKNDFRVAEILPGFYCSLAQVPNYNGIDIRAEVTLTERTVALNKYADKLHTGIRGYDSREKIAFFLASLNNAKFSTEVADNKLIVKLLYMSFDKFVENRVLSDFLDFFKRCIKHPFEREGVYSDVSRRIMMRSNINLFIKSRWSPTYVAKKVRRIFRELKNRKISGAI